MLEVTQQQQIMFQGGTCAEQAANIAGWQWACYACAQPC